jgi:TRAP transporter TAXI family solute receptor
MVMRLINKFNLFVVGIVFISLTLLFTPVPGDASDKYITIGTGGVTGVYYPAGGAICRLVNRGRKEHGIRCSVESTGGSVYNLNALRSNELDVAVAQSDWQYHSYKGTGPFANLGPDKNLRSLFSLHSEPFTVVARADAGVEKFDDLVNKRVNIGNPGSGMRATMEVIMKKKGWTRDTFKLTSELKASEQAQALCDNKIDVMIYSAGHPNGAIQEATTSCKTKIISVDGPEIKALVDDNPYYAYATIPGGMYSGNPDDIKTFGVKATFVSSSKVDSDLIYQVVRAVFNNFENFKTLHPVFSNLEAKRLVYEGNTAPLHAGAARYFEEKGLLKEGKTN